MHTTLCAEKYLFFIDFLLGSADRSYQKLEKSFCLRYWRESIRYALTRHRKLSIFTSDVVVILGTK